MIDIIIPAYNSHETIEQTLFSIAYQDIAHMVNVYVVDDCSKKNYNDIVKFFSNFINIKELRLDKNGGPGVARQYGLDNSDSEYVMFMDSDDVLYNNFALVNLYYNITQNNSDVSISEFIEETSNTFVPHVNDRIWVHGKMYRRSFLEKENIRFNDTRANEDNGFNQCVFLSDAKVTNVDKKTYIWRNRPNSICRRNDFEFNYKSVYGYVYNILYALEHAIKKGYNSEKIGQLSFGCLVAMYHYYLQFGNKVDEAVNLTKKVKKIYDKNKISEEAELDIIYNQFIISVNANRKALLNPKFTFKEFLKIIQNIEVKND